MQVYWLEQTECDVPPANNWLSLTEAVTLNGLRFPKRRADWRLGRWTAKNAVASFLNLPAHHQALANIEIRPAPSGAPEAFIAGAPAPVSISISHRNANALCAVAPSVIELGCDLEIIESRSEAFLEDYFTAEEQDLIAHSSPADRSRILALLWSAKESALKALQDGLRVDTRSVVVSPSNGSSDLNDWNPLQVRCADGSVFHGWWRSADGILRTLVAYPHPDAPIPLGLSSDFPENASFDFQKARQKTREAVSHALLGEPYAPQQ